MSVFGIFFDGAAILGLIYICGCCFRSNAPADRARKPLTIEVFQPSPKKATGHGPTRLKRYKQARARVNVSDVKIIE